MKTSFHLIVRLIAATVLAAALAATATGCAGSSGTAADRPSATSGTARTSVTSAPPDQPTNQGLDLPTTVPPTLDVPTTIPRPLQLPGFHARLVIKTCKLDVSISNEAIGFGYDSAEISERGRAGLAAVAGQLHGATGITIVGHTSTEGDAAYNQDLSQRRARAVADELRRAVPGGQFSVVGAGESQPLVVPDDTEDRRAQNRRVVITATIKAKVCS
jgi:outer membrane protein OmpA-like peptidoglycan-associated protein